MTERIERNEAALHAYHDGELGWLARRRFERRLAGSPELRRELGALATLRELARQADAESPAPDLWDRIASQLAQDREHLGPDAEREPSARPSWSLGLSVPLLRPVAAAAAAAAVVVALAIGLRTGDTGLESVGVVRWIDPGANSVMVLEDEGNDATIIWMLEATDEVSRGGGRDVA